MCNSVSTTPCTNKLIELELGAPWSHTSDLFLILEVRLFEITNMPLFNKQYVNDTFVIFYSRSESKGFFHTVNQLHLALTFTCTFEHNKRLPSLDVFAGYTNFGEQFLIYCKTMSTGLYSWWGSFCPLRCKID